MEQRIACSVLIRKVYLTWAQDLNVNSVSPDFCLDTRRDSQT